MMSNTKRLNLYFNMEKEEDREAYFIISDQVKKKKYLVGAINSYENCSSIGYNDIKDAMKEVLDEFEGFSSLVTRNKDDDTKEIPKDIFDDILNI